MNAHPPTAPIAVVRRERLALDARRAQLLELGLGLFNSRAYDEISIDDIALAAGISKGLLYHYYPSKRHFYIATVRAAVDRLLAATAPDPAREPREQLRAGLDAYLGYVRENAHAYATLLRSGIGADPEVASVVDEAREAMMSRIAKGMGLDRPRGAVRVALRGWVGFVEASAIEWVVRRTTMDRAALLGMLSHVLGAAIATAARAEDTAPRARPTTARRRRATTTR